MLLVDARQDVAALEDDVAELRSAVDQAEASAAKATREASDVAVELAQLRECIPELAFDVDAIETYLLNPDFGFSSSRTSRACTAILYGPGD